MADRPKRNRKPNQRYIQSDTSKPVTTKSSSSKINDNLDNQKTSNIVNLQVSETNPKISTNSEIITSTTAKTTLPIDSDSDDNIIPDLDTDNEDENTANNTNDIGQSLYPSGPPTKSWKITEIKAFLAKMKKKKTGNKDTLLQTAQVVSLKNQRATFYTFGF